MSQFDQIRNVLLCALVTLPLVACGDGSNGSSASATAANGATTTALVAPNVGILNRNGSGASAGSTGSNTNSTTPSTAATTPPSTGSGTPTGPVPKANPPTTVNGVATLDWMPPTENSDGSALTNLAGYTVYYGTSPGNLSQSVKVANPGLTAYSVTGLASGTWYFAITSYSASGVESSRTTMVSTKI